MSTADDLPPPPPGGFYRDPGPAGPEGGTQRALERIADALEMLGGEVHALRELLARGAGNDR